MSIWVARVQELIPLLWSSAVALAPYLFACVAAWGVCHLTNLSRERAHGLGIAPELGPLSNEPLSPIRKQHYLLFLLIFQLTRRRTRGNLKGGARYCLLAGTLDGGLGAILPVDERVFRRLYALQGIMSNALAHTGAANPRYEVHSALVGQES